MKKYNIIKDVNKEDKLKLFTVSNRNYAKQDIYLFLENSKKKFKKRKLQGDN